MHKFQELADNLAGIAADVAPLQGDIGELKSTIAQLQLQLANAGATLPADAQASLDLAVEQSAGIKTAFDGMVAGLTSTANAAKQSAENPPVPATPVVPDATQPSASPPASLTGNEKQPGS